MRWPRIHLHLLKIKKIEGKLDALVNLVTQLAMNQKSTPVARVHGLCSSADHHTDLCLSLQQSGINEQPEAYAANIYNRSPQQQNQQQQNNYDLSSSRYNPGWRNHPNLRWASPLHNNSLSLPSRMLLVQASHMFLLQCSNSSNHNKDNKQLRPLLNLP